MSARDATGRTADEHLAIVERKSRARMDKIDGLPSDVRELVHDYGYPVDHRCSHHIEMDSSQWGDDVRLSDIEPKFICQRCGKRGADVRPLFPPANMGVR